MLQEPAAFGTKTCARCVRSCAHQAFYVSDGFGGRVKLQICRRCVLQLFQAWRKHNEEYFRKREAHENVE